MKGQERLAELDHGVAAHGFRESLFNAAKMFEAGEHALAALGREDDALGATVVGIGDAREDAGFLEVVDELSHRLLGDSDALGEGGLTGSVEVDVWEEGHVRGTRPKAAG